jgi:hypothetical protein
MLGVVASSDFAFAALRAAGWVAAAAVGKVRSITHVASADHHLPLISSGFHHECCFCQSSLALPSSVFHHECFFCQSLLALPLLPNIHSSFLRYLPYLTL